MPKHRSRYRPVGAGNLLWFMSEMKGQNSLGSDTNVPVTKSLTQ